MRRSPTRTGGVTSFTYCSGSSCVGFAIAGLSVISMTDPQGLTTTFSYAENTEINKNDYAYCEAQTTITDPHGEVSTNTQVFPIEQPCVEGAVPAQNVSTVGSNLSSGGDSTTYDFTSGTWDPTSVVDANNHTTTYTYNSNNEVASSTDPLSHKTSYTYNSFGEVLTTTDPLGIVETNTFDADGNLTKKVLTADSSCSSNCTLTATDTVCESTTCTVGSNKYLEGETESATDPDGHVTNYTYDSYGDVATTTTNPSSGVTDTTQDVYNADGEKVCEASPNAVAAGTNCPAAGSPRVAGTTTWVYNSDGQLTSTTDADGNTTSYTYDGDGDQSGVTDGLGNVTKTTYDKDDRVSTVTDGSGSSAATTTSYTYDIAASSCPSAPTGTLWCTQETDGLGNTTTSYYNGLDDMIEVAPPNTTAETPTTYTYDGVGNVLSMTNGSGTTSNTYDADNQITGVSYSNTASGITTPRSVSYTYDADGERTKMVDGTGTTTYTYDGFERLISDQDGAGNTVTYGYDADGNVACLSYPNSGTKTCSNANSGTGLVTYTYNGASKPIQMSDWLGNTTTFAYDNDGNLVTTTLANGTSTTISNSYDPTDALTDTSVTTSGTKTDLAGLTRNADENIATTNAPTTTYGYDALNRVTTGSTANYTYDADSEITSITPSGGSATDYGYDTDGQLCWIGSSTGTCGSPPTGATLFSYNPTGERTGSVTQSGSTTTYGWDQAGNLVCETAVNTSGYSCTNPNSSATSSYTYDGDGLRMSDTPAGGSSQQFTWNTLGSVPELVEDGSNYYLYGPSVGSAPIEQISVSGSNPSYLVSDTTGVREQINGSGSVVGSMSYDTYGNRCSSCSIATPFGFVGSYTDNSGNLYLDHRYYDPTTEQFISVDPEVSKTGQPYSYTGGDPVNATDPSGKDCTTPVCEGWINLAVEYCDTHVCSGPTGWNLVKILASFVGVAALPPAAVAAGIDAALAGDLSGALGNLADFFATYNVAILRGLGFAVAAGILENIVDKIVPNTVAGIELRKLIQAEIVALELLDLFESGYK